MATSQTTIDYLLDQLADSGEASARKMFGEYCLYSLGKPIGLVCDDQLFLKPTEPGRELIEELEEASPYPGAKPHLLISADLWEDSDWLCALIKATERALPAPKPRKKKKKK